QKIKKLEDTEIDNIIRQYFTTLLKLQGYFQFAASSSRTQVSDSVIDNLSHIIIPLMVHHVEEIRSNALAQKKLAELKEIAEKNLKELENIYNITINIQLCKNLLTRILDLEYGFANKHRCKEAIKGARQFAQAFSNTSIIISQDDKAKMDLYVPAVSRMFHTLQSALEPVQVPDHNFVCRSNQKLILLVYLMIKPSEINDNLQTRQMAIFVKIQWSIGTSSITHVEDISSLSYCKLFRKFDLNYLNTYARSEQFKYNLVERNMFTLSGKLAGIILPINYFGNYLDSQGKIIDAELATQNFHYA
ncbi:24795_t:CDS:2, partial [Gigaspora margarita]